MKTFYLFILVSFIAPAICSGQDNTDHTQIEPYRIRTVFKSGQYASGGYGAIGNKFTTLDGQFANMAEVYGGWFVNHKFMIGLGFAATTNNIEVPAAYSTRPDVDMSYEYGQGGLMLEYTLWSHRVIHFSFHCLNGGAFTVQYQRDNFDDNDYWDEDSFDYEHDTNFFFVTEPGVKVEVNVFKWMRFGSGVSYRAAFGSDGLGLKDKDVSAASMNFTLKFGKF